MAETGGQRFLGHLFHPIFKSLSFLTAKERNVARALLHSTAAKVLTKTSQAEPKDEGGNQPEVPSLTLSDVPLSLPLLPIKHGPGVQNE